MISWLDFVCFDTYPSKYFREFFTVMKDWDHLVEIVSIVLRSGPKIYIFKSGAPIGAIDYFYLYHYQVTENQRLLL